MDIRWSFLGEVPYPDAWTIQKNIRTNIIENDGPDCLLALSHPHVYTLGKRDASDCMLVSNDRLADENAQIVQTDRGGLATYHGPGQLVVYPIMHLQRHLKLDVVGYVSLLEETMIRTCKHYGIIAFRMEKMRGIWVRSTQIRPKKIGAVGIHVHRHVTNHGFALNVAPDLSRFNRIIPCGLQGYGVTSFADLGIENTQVEDVARTCIQIFGDVFSSSMLERNPHDFAVL